MDFIDLVVFLCYFVVMKPLNLLNNPPLKTLLRRQGVVLAYLFGSQAKGTATQFSDIDIAVCFSKRIKPENYFSEEIKLAGAVDRLLHTDKTQIINLAASKSPLLRHRAVLQGKPILISDRRLHNQLASVILKEYEDTAFLRHMQSALLKKRLAEGRFAQSEPTGASARRKHVPCR